MHLGILAGLQSEARCLSPGLESTSGFGASIRLSGARLDGARRAAEALLADGSTHLLSFGLAGGLDPALPPGTLLLPDTVLGPTGEPYRVDDAWYDRARNALAPLKPVGGLLAGADIAIPTPVDKAALFAQTRACAVDMESHILAIVARRARLPFLVLRVVADGAHESLPPAALVAVKPDGSTSLPAVLASILRQPWQVPALIRLGQSAKIAERVLRDAGARLVAARLSLH